MSLGRKATLNTGAQIPLLGFGTWQSEPGQVSTAVYEALKAGYRHLDLAKVYGNQKEVAQGIKKAFSDVPGLKREDVFITSKLWNSQHRPEHVAAALDDCLAELELDYLDLYLMHFPVAFDDSSKDPHHTLFPLSDDGAVKMNDDVTIVDTWKAMTKLDKTKARAVGVSNFTPAYLDAVIKATDVVPAANQVERHPLLPWPELVKYCKDKNIHITAYSGFGNNMFGEPLIITYPQIKEIADRLKGTPAQVVLAWSQIGDHSVIPKSVTPSRIKENFQEVELSNADIKTIDKIGDKPRRYNIPYVANKPVWPVDIFGTPEEKEAPHKVVV
ncbi:mitochondrial glycerol dehydrogenase Gld1 [Meristemomyces frigidus]|uniref:Mitochondrial glycerol dehydrogenase Gld1 n=1 Tax=Meristemomyces frigidus TaxID=1508187 RepID=A0AAN7YFQ4_9PEZI|nr:mitochondrial glycerol dehydrogenase Gld1 [Meristemomyces frigidus]